MLIETDKCAANSRVVTGRSLFGFIANRGLNPTIGAVLDGPSAADALDQMPIVSSDVRANDLLDKPNRI